MGEVINRDAVIAEIYDSFMTVDGRVHDKSAKKCMEIIGAFPPAAQKAGVTEDDYIAEYIREKYPFILGFEFALWKFARQLSNTVRDTIEMFKSINWKEIESLSKAESEVEHENT